MTCINCSAALKKNATKYCSISCQHEYQSKLRKEKINSGGVVTNRAMRTILTRERGKKCEECQLESWQNQPIPLELDHIDGNPDNNHTSNLRLLCPNCHALTPTYKSRNKGNGRHSRRQRYAEGKSF